MSLPPALAQWRKALRASLIERRLAVAPADHAEWSARIEALLHGGFPLLERMTIGLCWPYQGEFDARSLVRDCRRRGARAALPAVVAKGAPLEFREWWPGVAMLTGVFGLPVPDGTAILQPDALLIPAVGIGARGDRLGYGGGFFDRTLAASEPKPICIALAFELSRVPTTNPQPHDVLMDFVVTEAGIEAAVPGALEAIDADECARQTEALARARGLWREDAARQIG